MTPEEILLRFAVVIAVGVGAQLIAGRLRIPSILLLLSAGFVLGRATGFIEPGELLGDLLVPFVSISVVIILFEGGLTLRVSDLPAPARNKEEPPRVDRSGS
jgi:NhaP-type Na+/H+ or K+/H+ antiporter